MSVATVGHAGGSIGVVIIPWGIDSPVRNLGCGLACILEGVFLEEFTILQGSLYGDADSACLINEFPLLADRVLPFQLLSVNGHKTESPSIFAGYPFILLAVWCEHPVHLLCIVVNGELGDGTGGSIGFESDTLGKAVAETQCHQA